MFKCIQNYMVLLLLVFVSSSALSVVEVREFSSDQLRDRYQVLANELRCPKCQNQNLADSNSPISVDLRTEIFRLLEEGKSDQEIIDFLVARYGEFVMYRPPVKKTTLMLWLAPGILFLFGIIIVLAIRQRQSHRSLPASELDGDELQRLDELLGDTPVIDEETEDKKPDNKMDEGERA
ncbi:MAG: cytochrome c-type biogenesis protein CcmH [Porticoccus sp.]|nr:cytochrome c-type biogenesis protein CcmH [Porticoccus sp.]